MLLELRQFYTIKITKVDVLTNPKKVGMQKGTGPDKINPNILLICAKELDGPLTKVFQNCMFHKKIAQDMENNRRYKKNDRSLVKKLYAFITTLMR